MKLFIAKLWLTLLGLAFVGLLVFAIMQIPVEVWITIGFFLGLGIIIGFTKWAVEQLPEVEDEPRRKKLGGK